MDRAYLDAAFEEVDRVFGDMGGYVRDGLGVSAMEVQNLQRTHLVDG